jgi:hypothetical protein
MAPRLKWSAPPPTNDLAYEARKAPGGAYHHNIFHQSEHLSCLLQTAIQRNEAPALILWPYSITPWARALVGVILPHTQLVSTCCGREKVAATWWRGVRRVCPCWQRICPGYSSRPAFWPGASGRAAHSLIRAAVRGRCGLSSLPSVASAHAPVVRLLLRPGSSRQLEDAARVLAAVHSVTGERAEVAVSDADALLKRAGNVRGSHAGANHVGGDHAGIQHAGNASVAADTSFLCDQARWYAHADVVLSVHGSQTTNALFADAHAWIVDLQPYAYTPTASAPQDYYAALLQNTDVRYLALPSAKPAATPFHKGASDEKRLVIDARVRDDPEKCRRDTRCRLAYRDGGNISLGDEGMRVLRRILGERLALGGRGGRERRL